MTAQKQHTVAIFEGLLKMFQPVHLRDTGQFGRIPEPGDAQLHYANAVGDEGVTYQRTLLLLVEFREAKADVGLGNMPTAFSQLPGGQADHLAQPPLKADR